MIQAAYNLIGYVFITVFTVCGVVASVVLWGGGLIAFITRGRF